LDERSHKRQLEEEGELTTAQIVKRLREHEIKTLPVIEKYRQTNQVVQIDGQGTFEEVFQRVSREVESGMKNMR
jgi:adenylate kinase